MNKSVIRKKILNIRKKNDYKNLKINFKSIIKILRKKNIKAKVLGGYYPYNYEINIIQILEKFEKLKYSIALPKINKNSDMNFFYWSTNDPLNVNKYGIPEPISNKLAYPSIILVPIVAFDKHFNRIGYGGGFYDRYIKNSVDLHLLINYLMLHKTYHVLQNKLLQNQLNCYLPLLKLW